MTNAKNNTRSKASSWIAEHWLWLVGGVALFLFAWFLYWIRPFSIIRGPFMIVWRHPALFTLPFLASLCGLLLVVAIKAATGGYKKRPVSRRYSYWEDHHGREPEYERLGSGGVEFAAWLIPGVIALIVAMIWTSAWTSESLYHNTNYQGLHEALLEGSQMRVKPYDVALKQIEASLNESENNPGHLSIIKVNGKLTWTAVNDPNGFIRSFSHGSEGMISVPAESSLPKATVGTPATTGDFHYSPGSVLGRNFGWHAHKICYTCDIPEVFAEPTARGPILVAPYVQWQGGWFVNHPVFGGVFVENTHGSFKQLNAKQAESDPELVAAGHIFPETLARRIAQAYAYKHGIANKLFTHKEQYEIDEEASEGEINEQPYMEDFKNLGMQWVTTMKPTGNTYTTGAIITTSAINGQTRLWLTPKSPPLIDGGKAIEIVRGQPIPGVTFADAGASDSGGKFLAIEPRQVFPPGRGLQFLISVVPSEETRVSLNVVVDAKTQSVVAVFQADQNGDADLVNYLGTGQLPASEQFNAVGAGSQSTTSTSQTPENTTATTSPVPLPASASAVATLERLLSENKAQQTSSASQLRALRAEQADLEKLLATAKSAKK